MSDSGIKVTDRRMFTEDGELREDRVVGEESGAGQAEAASTSGVIDASEPGPTEPVGGEDTPPPAAEPPPVGGAPRPAELMDLVGMLYEQIALALGDARLPSGESFEDLGRAQMYIDLLRVLQEKTRGNLSSDEDSLLEDLLYRVQLRFVEKQRGQ